MATIITREVGATAKGTTLSNAEIDNNFINLNTDIATRIPASEKGAVNGVATLDGAGKVPATQLPSYVDDVIEAANLVAFPETGETGKIYVALDTNKTYRWSGSAYIFITSGAVDSVAGKTGVVTLTSADVGLANVDNTSDANKPVSTATQTALNTKQDTLVSGTTIKTVNGTSVLGEGNIQIDGGVTSFNTRTGAVSLTSADVTDALGFSPVNKAGDTITGDLLNSAAYSAPSNSEGAGTTLKILGSTGTGIAGTTGGNGQVEILGGGATSVWATPSNSTRGGVLVQTGTAQADANNTYVAGSTLELRAGSGTTNGTQVGFGGRINIGAGGTTRADGNNSSGASVIFWGGRATQSGYFNLASGTLNFGDNFERSSGGLIDSYPGTPTEGGELNLRSGFYSSGAAQSFTSNTGGNIVLTGATATTGGNILLYPGAASSTVAGGVNGTVKIDDYIVLHAGNYSSYALPLSGGTITGTLFINSGTGATDYNDLWLGGANGWATNESHGINTYYGSLASPSIFTRVDSLFDGTKAIMRWKNFYFGGAPQTSAVMTLTATSATSAALNVTGAITQAGNQVLHAGNYNSYALPLSGGELSGPLTFTNTNVRRRINVTIDNRGVWDGQLNGYLLLAKAYVAGLQENSEVTGKVFLSRGGTAEGRRTETIEIYSKSAYNSENFLVNSPGGRDFTAGTLHKVTYNGTVYHAIRLDQQGGGPYQAFTFDGWTTNAGLIVAYDSEVSNVTAFGSVGLVVALDGLLYENTNKLLHAGNFNSYALPLTGGTLTGNVNISRSADLPAIDFQSTGVVNSVNWRIRSGIEGVTNGGFSIKDLTADVTRFSIDGSGTVNVAGAITQAGNQVLHAGNYSSYALPLTGGTLTGALNVSRQRLSFSSSYNDANHSIYNNYTNIDGEGVFDGMKMNVYDGLRIRVGNASGTTPVQSFGIDSAGSVWMSQGVTLGSRTNTSTFGGNTTGMSGNSFVAEIRANSAKPTLTFHYENVATTHIEHLSDGSLNVWRPSVEGDSILKIGNNVALHASNYNSYAPTLTGGGASGTWGINITGNAATVSSISSAQVTGALGYTPYPDNTPNGYSAGDINGNTTHQRLWGTDSVQDMLAFSSPTEVEYSTDGTTWTTTTIPSSVFTGKVSGQWGGASFNVGNNIGGWRFVRLTWRNFGYRFWSHFTLAHSTNGHSFNFVFYKSDLSGNFGAAAFRQDGISSWPGYTFTKYSDVSGWWDTRDIRMVFELNHSGDANNPINIGHIGLMGSYGGFTRLFDWNASREMYFANVYVTGSNHQVLHAGNYNSYSPTLTGGSASGTWGINITGFANAGTPRLYASDAPYTFDGANPYYAYMTYNGGANRWRLQVSPATPSEIEVAYADVAGSATTAATNSVSTASGSQKLPNDYATSRVTYENSSNFTGLGDWYSAITVRGRENFAWQFVGPSYDTAYGSDENEIYFRAGSGTSWSPLRQVLHSGNIGFFAPSKTGVGASGTWGINISGAAASAATLSNNATITGLNFGGVLALTGSGATTDNATGARLTESYGPQWNLGDSATWHYQVLNGSLLVGISAGGTNYGSGNIRAASQIYAETSNLVLHAGNYNSYALPLSGGTVTGVITSSISSGTVLNMAGQSDSFGYNGTSGLGTYIKGTGSTYIYGGGKFFDGLVQTLLHSGNYSSYALPLSGGTVGDLRINFVSGSGGHSFGTSHYSMGKDIANGGWSDPHYSDLIIGYHTGIRIGAHYSGIRFYNNSPTTDANNDGAGDGGEALLMTVGGYVGTANHTDVVVNNNLFANSSVRAPIFYDSNDTSYYVDPNSFSQLSYANLNASPSGRTLSLGGDQTNRIINDAARSSLVINASYYPHLYINATENASNPNHGPVFSMTGVLTAGGYRRWGMGIANTDPDCFSWGYYDNETNPHYGVGGVFGYTATNSKMWLNTGGSLMTTGDMRAPIFYDSNDTAYYINPNGGSRLWDLNIEGASNKYLYLNPGNGHEAMVRYNGGSGSGWYVGKRTSDQLIGTANFHFYSEAAGQTVGGINTSGDLLTIGSMRSPIFYDTNNTAYYIDPNVASRLHGMLIVDGDHGDSTLRVRLNAGSNGAATGEVALQMWCSEPGVSWDWAGFGYNVQNDNGANGFGRPNTSFGQAYMRMGTGGQWYFYTTDTSGTRTTNMYLAPGNGVETYGILRNDTDVRAPLYYDSNDTTYYLDPASAGVSLRIGGAIQGNHTSWTGEMNKIQWHSGHMYFQNTSDGLWIFRNSNGVEPYVLNADGSGTAGGSWRAPIFYDSNDTAFYLDPNTTGTSLNVAGAIVAGGNITAFSDETLKADWTNLPSNYVEQLANLLSGTFTRKDTGQRQAGVGAQSLQKFLPEVVVGDTTLSVAYGNAALVSAVELAKRVVEQDLRIAKLEALVAQLLAK